MGLRPPCTRPRADSYNKSEEVSFMSEIVIVSGTRTPMGGFQGSLSGVSAVDLGAIAIREAISRAGIQPADVQEVIMGLSLIHI